MNQVQDVREQGKQTNEETADAAGTELGQEEGSPKDESLIRDTHEEVGGCDEAAKKEKVEVPLIDNDLEIVLTGSPEPRQSKVCHFPPTSQLRHLLRTCNIGVYSDGTGFCGSGTTDTEYKACIC